jgi:RNA polymerase sigma factor (sigma-70 family)
MMIDHVSKALSERDDAELSELVRQGRNDAYAELWRRHADASRRFAAGYRRLADPEDLVAEAYAMTLRALRAGQGPTGPFKPYLFTTIRRLAQRALERSSHDAYETPEELADELPELPVFSEEEGDDRRIVAEAFARLPERWRTVLWHTEVEGRSNAEIGELMGLKPTAVAVLAFRARAALREAWLATHLSPRGAAPECRKVWEQLAAYELGSLTTRARERVTAHLDECTRCRRGSVELRAFSARVAGVIAVLGLGGALAAAGGAQPASADSSRSMARVARVPRSPAVRAWATIAGIGTVAVAGTVFTIADAVTGLDAARPPAAASDPQAPVQRETVVPEPTPTSGTGTPDASPPTAAPSQPAPAKPVAGPPAADTTPPAAPRVTSSWSDDQLVPLSVSGTGEPGATVSIALPDGTTLATTTADAAGAWSVASIPGISPTVTQLVVRQTDAAGNTSATSTVGPFAFVPSIVSPSDGATVPSGPLALTFAGWPGSELLVTINGAGAGIYTVPASGSLTVSFTSPSGGAVAPGSYDIGAAYYAAGTAPPAVHTLITVS